MDSTTLSQDGLEIVNCSLCWDENVDRYACVYCKDCLQFLCEQCKIQHNRFPTMRDHQTVDILDHGHQTIPKMVATSNTNRANSSDQDISVESLEKCRQHPECYINMFCEDHAIQCCGRCAFELHRDCLSVIPDLLKESRHIRRTDYYKENISTMKEQLQQLKHIKNEHHKEISKSKTERSNLEQDIEDFYDELKEKLDQMKTKTLSDMNKKYNTQQKKIMEMYTELNNITNKVERYLQQLEDTNIDDVQCFIKYRKGKDIADSLARAMVTEKLEASWNPIMFTKTKVCTSFLTSDCDKLGDLKFKNPVNEDKTKVQPMRVMYRHPWLPVGGVFH